MGLFLLFLKGLVFSKEIILELSRQNHVLNFITLPTIREFEDSAIFSFLPAFAVVHSVDVVYE